MSRSMLGIFWGGLMCGILDLTSAFVAHVPRGVRPILIPQSIASGLLGRQAYEGGIATAVLGVSLHFLIAFSAATVFYLASRKLNFLLRRPVVSGIVYGEVVYVVMNFVVIPLSAIHRWPPAFSFPALITGPLGHPFAVGLPIALAIKHFAPKPEGQKSQTFPSQPSAIAD